MKYRTTFIGSKNCGKQVVATSARSYSYFRKSRGVDKVKALKLPAQSEMF